MQQLVVFQGLQVGGCLPSPGVLHVAGEQQEPKTAREMSLSFLSRFLYSSQKD